MITILNILITMVAINHLALTVIPICVSAEQFADLFLQLLYLYLLLLDDVEDILHGLSLHPDLSLCPLSQCHCPEDEWILIEV